MAREDSPPPALLWAGLVLLVGVVVLTLIARIAAPGRTTALQSEHGTCAAHEAGDRIVLSRKLRFDDLQDGGVLVSTEAGRTVARLAPGTQGFVRGVLRGLVRERRVQQVAGDAPPLFALERWQAGRLTLCDSATGSRIELRAFGSDNAAEFERLLQ